GLQPRARRVPRPPAGDRPRAALRLASRERIAGRRSDRAARRVRLWRLPALRGDGRAFPDHARGQGPVRAGHAGARHLQRLPGADRGGDAARRAPHQPYPELHLPRRAPEGRDEPDDLYLRLRGRTDDPRAGRASRRQLYGRRGDPRRAGGSRPCRFPLLHSGGRARRRRQCERFGPRHCRHLQSEPHRARADAAPRERDRSARRRHRWPRPVRRPGRRAAVIGRTNVTPALAAEMGLSADEFARVEAILGRTPNLTELGIFSAMWSEHCSYKSSKVWLKTLPTTGPRVICGPGENAGVVDIGDGDAVVFKIESHNHPSFIEPYQGAATGVGGILRDVFTMGARPIAILDALRFGSPDHPKTRHLIGGVVSGIGGYGNCVGVPTVGGETQFHPSYNGNILVNAMCVGLARADRIFYSAASGAGNSVIYVGAKTGRDGIHGATMASAEFGEGSEEKRPTVQVGDP